jgi:hypothetical protein
MYLAVPVVRRRIRPPLVESGASASSANPACFGVHRVYIIDFGFPSATMIISMMGGENGLRDYFS